MPRSVAGEIDRMFGTLRLGVSITGSVPATGLSRSTPPSGCGSEFSRPLLLAPYRTLGSEALSSCRRPGYIATLSLRVGVKVPADDEGQCSFSVRDIFGLGHADVSRKRSPQRLGAGRLLAANGPSRTLRKRSPSRSGGCCSTDWTSGRARCRTSFVRSTAA